MTHEAKTAKAISLKNILQRYNIIENDLEYEIYFDDSIIVCVPDYRFNTRATTHIRCYNKYDLDNGIITPSWYRSIIHFLYNIKDKTIKKIVITKDGEPIKTFHGIVNDLW